MMLRTAQLYKDKLTEENIRIWHNPEYMFWSGGAGDAKIDLPEDNYERHCFVSVDGNDNIIGYIAYSVDWIVMSADRFEIINFQKGNMKISMEFVKDVYKSICNLFEVYHMNRMEWWCYADNPAIRGYRNFIKRCGGKECAYLRQVAKLQDGKLHDVVYFEILAHEFKVESKV